MGPRTGHVGAGLGADDAALRGDDLLEALQAGSCWRPSALSSTRLVLCFGEHFELVAALDPRRAAPQPAPKGAQPAEYTLLSPAALAAIDPRRPADPEAEEVAEAEAADPDLHWSLGSFGRAAACALVGLAGVAAWRATTFSRRARAVEGEAVRAEWEVAEAIYKPM